MITADGSGALGAVGTWLLGGSSRVFAAPSGVASQLSSARGALAMDGWMGPMSVGVEGTATAAGWVERDASSSDLAAWTNLRAGLPLSRRFSSGIVHRIEPQLVATLLRARSDAGASSAVGRPAVLSEGTHWVASAGASTAIGRVGEQRGVGLDVAGGGIGENADDLPSGLARGDLVVSAHAFSLRWRGAAVLDAEGMGALVLGRVKLGGARTAMLMGEVATRSQLDPGAARALDPTEPTWIGADALDRAGTSLMLAAGIPLLGGVRAESVGHWDVGAARALSTGGGLTYEHPCGCLAARSWLGRRVGREGVDAWLSLDLIPR